MVPIFVRTLTGKTIVVDTDEETTVQELKDLISETEGIPPDQQRLIFRGFQL